MSNIFFNYSLLITRGSPLSLLNKPNVKLIHSSYIQDSNKVCFYKYYEVQKSSFYFT